MSPHPSSLLAVLKSIQNRLDALSPSHRALPLICLALDENILPQELYESLEETDLTEAASGGNAHPLLLLWIRRYYERSDGGEWYIPTILGPLSGGTLANLPGWKEMLKSRYTTDHVAPLKPGKRHPLCAKGSTSLQMWMRGQCWVLKAEDRGDKSRAFRNNTAIHQVLTQKPSLEDAEFEELLETDGLGSTLQKNGNYAYLRWIWEDDRRRHEFINSLRALSGEGDKPGEDHWTHRMWKAGVTQNTRASWKLCLNGADDSYLRLAFNVNDETRSIIQEELEKQHLQLRPGHYLPVEGNAEQLAHIGKRNGRVDIPELGEGILFFSVRSARELRKSNGVFSEWCCLLTHTRSLWVTHRQADQLTFRINDADILPAKRVELRSPFPADQGKYVADLLDLRSFSNEQLSGQLLSVCVNGRPFTERRLAICSHIEWGEEWMQGVCEVDAQTYTRKGGNTQFFCGDRVEILNAELWDMEPHEHLSLQYEAGRCWLLLRDARYTETLSAVFTRKDGGKRLHKKLCFMPTDWLSGEHLLPCRMQKIREMVPHYRDSRPRLVTRYTGFGKRMTFLRDLTAPLLYWSTPGTQDEDFFETREDFRYLDEGSGCSVYCISPADASADASLNVLVNGESLGSLRYTHLDEINDVLQKRGATPGCKLSLTYAGEGGLQQLFNGRWTPRGSVLTRDLQLCASQWPQQLTLYLEHEQCRPLPAISNDSPLPPCTLTLQAPAQAGVLPLAPVIDKALADYPAGYVKLCITGHRLDFKWDGSARTEGTLPPLQERWQKRLGQRSPLAIKATLRVFAQDIPELERERAALDSATGIAFDSELLDMLVSPGSLHYLQHLGESEAAVLDAALELTQQSDSRFEWGGAIQLWKKNNKGKLSVLPVSCIFRSPRGYEYARQNNTRQAAENICVTALAAADIAAQRGDIARKPHGEYGEILRLLAERIRACIPVRAENAPGTESCLQTLADLLPLMRGAGPLCDNQHKSLLRPDPDFASGAGTLLYYIMARLDAAQAALLLLACCHYQHKRSGRAEATVPRSPALSRAFELALDEANKLSYSKCCNLVSACFTYFATQA